MMAQQWKQIAIMCIGLTACAGGAEVETTVALSGNSYTPPEESSSSGDISTSEDPQTTSSSSGEPATSTSGGSSTSEDSTSTSDGSSSSEGSTTDSESSTDATTTTTGDIEPDVQPEDGEVYAQCEESNDCNGDSICYVLNYQGEYDDGFCTVSCMTAADCPQLPQQSIQPECRQSTKKCILPCEQDMDCPLGMKCRDLVDNSSYCW